MELYLVRHTTPDVAQGVCYGHADVDLHGNALEEIAAVRAKLADVRPDAFYTSPSLRCSRLAAALPWGPAHPDPRLKEMHFGEWELQAWESIPREVFDDWSKNFVEQAPPGGESLRELYLRSSAFLEECRERHAGQCVVAVTHGGVIRSMLAHALNLPLQHVPGFLLDFGGITKLVVMGPHINIAYVNR